MNLPFSLRHQFLHKGYAVVPNVMPRSVSQAIRAAAVEATQLRAPAFAELPTLDTVLRESSAAANPQEAAVRSYHEKRRALLRVYRAWRQQRRRNLRVVQSFLQGRRREDLTGEDLWQLSERLAETARTLSPERVTASRADREAAVRAAIDEYRCNAWMTSPELKRTLFEDTDLRARLAQVAEEVGGVEKAVVFADAPFLREAYGNPVYYHCTAPQIGTQTNVPMKRGGVPAVTLLLLTFTPSDLCMRPHVLEHSHPFVRQQYGAEVHPATLHTPFLPMEAHVPNMLQHFCFDGRVAGAALADPALVEGAVVVIDPHVFMAFDANLTNRAEVIYRLHLVNEDAVPDLQAPSWIRGWHGLPSDISFATPSIFPPLYTARTTCSQ
ncbi:hypothetical protein STCU_06576 [Strigomonas culicis]|uniref:Uncharacterized protein n=1 Tax=Strigomonas culicis TaxID=28005 RepID=S9U4I0_9TRYP|nr:hypothetical protein STCU_06576 [Strigomonas culicis]|eukprot:EPY25667.1 hypothetical protein STCU_06576 [Strigomonas culicis]